MSSTQPSAADPRLARVGIVDDHPVFRLGLRHLLQRLGGLEVEWDAAGGEEAIRLATSRPVDVVLVDLNLRDGDAIAAIRELAGRPQPPVVAVMSGLGSPEQIAEALSAGAAEMLPKDLEPEEMAAAIHRLAGRDSTGRERLRAARLPLTAREAEVLGLMRQGHTNREMAMHLGISLNTVNKHVQRVLRKLGARNRTHATVLPSSQSLGFSQGIERMLGPRLGA